MPFDRARMRVAQHVPPPPTVHKRQRTDFPEGSLPISVSVVPPIMQSTTTAGRPLASAQLLSPTPPSVPPTVPTPPPLCQETGATANVARSALSRQLTHAKLLPDGWSQHYSRTSQRHFFVNNATGQKVWASGALKHKNTLYEGAVPQGTSSGRAIAPMLLRHIQEQASHVGAEDIPNQFCPVRLTDTQRHSISSMPSPQMQKDAQWWGLPPQPAVTPAQIGPNDVHQEGALIPELCWRVSCLTPSHSECALDLVEHSALLRVALAPLWLWWSKGSVGVPPTGPWRQPEQQVALCRLFGMVSLYRQTLLSQMHSSPSGATPLVNVVEQTASALDQHTPHAKELPFLTVRSTCQAGFKDLTKTFPPENGLSTTPFVDYNSKPFEYLITTQANKHRRQQEQLQRNTAVGTMESCAHTASHDHVALTVRERIEPNAATPKIRKCPFCNELYDDYQKVIHACVSMIGTDSCRCSTPSLRYTKTWSRRSKHGTNWMSSLTTSVVHRPCKLTGDVRWRPQRCPVVTTSHQHPLSSPRPPTICPPLTSLVSETPPTRRDRLETWHTQEGF